MAGIVLLGLLPTAFALSSWFSQQEPLTEPVDASAVYDPFVASDFDAYIEGVMERQHTPGLAIAVVHGNKTFARAYGYSDVEAKIPMTPRTLFYAGSTTKSFTAATMSKLVDSNDSAYADISWTTKLADLIRDDFVLQDEYATNHINLVDALSHRTGLPRHDTIWINNDLSPREIVRQMRHVAMHRELREAWEYCNLMFISVGHAVETLTGRSFDELLREWIWKPLGMTEAFIWLDDALDYAYHTEGVEMARSYEWGNATSSYAKWDLSAMPPPNGAGALISNVLTYTHWIRMFLHPENDSNPISAKSIKEMTTPHMVQFDELLPVDSLAYGLGLDIASYRGHRYVGHGGEIFGYMTGMRWLPDDDWGMVIMQNTDSFSYPIIEWSMMDDFLRTPEAHRADIESKVREFEKAKLEQRANMRDKLYPGVDNSSIVGPALALKAYEGTYNHIAYGNYTLTLAGPDQLPFTGQDSGEQTPLAFSVKGSEIGYGDLNGILHHVNAEHWYLHARMGPGHWLLDDFWKAEFAVGPSGRVDGMRLKAEPALDQLAMFHKIL